VTAPTGSDAHLMDTWMHVPIFAALPARVQQAIVRHTVRREFQENETVFLEDDPVAGWFLVERGSIKISRFSKDGREHIIHFLRDGATFNDVAVLDGGPNPVTAIAHANSVLVSISHEDLQALAQQFPELGWALARSIARRARFLVNQVQDLSMRNVRGRLAALLLDEAGRLDEQEVPRMLTQDDMAARLGTVRDVVGRALRGLAADGIIEFDRHRIVILDMERLADEADI
jgi:CRP/FNR family cyclic AMP-dependent transcriptional regulator